MTINSHNIRLTLFFNRLSQKLHCFCHQKQLWTISLSTLLGLLYAKRKSASGVWTVVLCCPNAVQSEDGTLPMFYLTTVSLVDLLCHRMISSKLSSLLNFNSDACHLWIVPHCSAHQGNCRHQFFSSLETSPYLLLIVTSGKHNPGSTTTTLICYELLSTFFGVATASHHSSAQHWTKNIMYT